MPIFKNGKRVYDCPPLEEIKAYCAQQVDTLWDEVKRFDYPPQVLVPIEEPMAQQEIARTNLEKLRQTAHPSGIRWQRISAARALTCTATRRCAICPPARRIWRICSPHWIRPSGSSSWSTFIMAEGEIWDRLSDILCRKSRQGVEVKLIFDDFGSMMRMPNEKIDALQDAGVEVRVFNPVHHYVNRLYFNYRDHRKITCVDGDIALHRRRQYRRRVRQPDRTLRLLEGLRSPAGGRRAPGA